MSKAISTCSISWEYMYTVIAAFVASSVKLL